jgi:hypothetical protein
LKRGLPGTCTGPDLDRVECVHHGATHPVRQDRRRGEHRLLDATLDLITDWACRAHVAVGGRTRSAVSLVVLSYPAISQPDFRWIQAIRAKRDELYFRVVDPHFTFVFPIVGMDREVLCQHVREQARRSKKILFVLRCAATVKDAFTEYTHVFLMPAEGHSHIVKLHDRLYTDPLARYLLLDIPFIPHVGIANAVDPRVCKELADDLNRQDFAIRGTIGALDVASYENGTVETIERIDLERE